MVNIYSFFHLNILFSSIEKEQRSEVIQKCYWPLLNLIRETKIPIAIEASALTLKIINKYDKSWIEEFKKLLVNHQCEFIGSGYTQLIGPLVPWEINRKNQLIGQDIYQNLLNFRPDIALINEQAFSSNLIPTYLESGYKTIIMEWNNSFSFKNWDPALGYFRQRAISQCGKKIDLIWNNSINFQRFQRYAHSEMSLNEFVDLININNYDNANFLLYGSDAEIFNFRPGRFLNEAKIKNCEWKRIKDLYLYFNESKKYNLIHPSQVFFNTKNIKKSLVLNSPQQPITVKKQSKYNVFRWALTGRNDLEINTICYELFERLKKEQSLDRRYSKKICYLWSSDFRTHITEQRWIKYREKLDVLDKKTKFLKFKSDSKKNITSKKNIEYCIVDNYVIVSYDQTIITFNINKGLVIDSYCKSRIKSKNIFGTIRHGTFQDINWSADFYSGNLNFQSPGKAQVTDMEEIVPEIIIDNNKIILKSEIHTSRGLIKKEWIVDASLDIIKLKYYLNWDNPGLGKLSIVPITLNPKFFDNSSLYFKACNGSESPEKFNINSLEIDHTKNVSFLVSSQHGLGMTDGKFVIGDNRNNIEIYFQPSKCAFLGQVLHKKIGEMYFTRFILSGREFDDTAKYSNLKIDTEISYRINIFK